MENEGRGIRFCDICLNLIRKRPSEFDPTKPDVLLVTAGTCPLGGLVAEFVQ